MDNETPLPYVSIIVPTYNRAKMIGITLHSLIHLDYPTAKYEIIVVDNNSTDSTKEIIDQIIRKSFISMKYVFEERQGVHFARNTGALNAKGEILYYTDDDMIADQDLLQEIIRPFFIDTRVASVTGRVLPKWEKDPPAWVVYYCSNGLLSLQMRPEYLIISPNDIGVYSCHQAIRRDPFFKAGGFNPENTAGEWIGDGETGLNIKIQKMGYLFGFIGSSVTYHMIPSYRMTQKYLNKRLANQGNCDSYTDYRLFVLNRSQLALRIIYHIKSLILNSFMLPVRYFLRKGFWRFNRAYINYYINRIRYDIRLIFDQKWQKLVLRENWIDDIDHNAY